MHIVCQLKLRFIQDYYALELSVKASFAFYIINNLNNKFNFHFHEIFSLFLSAFDGFKIVVLTDMAGLPTVMILNVAVQSVVVGLLNVAEHIISIWY